MTKQQVIRCYSYSYTKEFSRRLIPNPPKKSIIQIFNRVECEALDRILSLTNEMYRSKKGRLIKRPFEKYYWILLATSAPDRFQQNTS